MKLSIFLLFCFGQLAHIVQANFRDSESDWTHKLNLEKEEGIKFQWRNTKPDKEGQRWIIMEATAKAKGYLGVGFSPHGGMAGADMAIAWMDSSDGPQIRDFYGIENGFPIQDANQDYQLLHFMSHSKGITIQFKRRWDTCDEEDFPITNDTMRLIWAFSDSKPKIRNENFVASYHGPQSRGAKSIIIAEGGILAPFPDDKPDLYPGVKTFDMKMDNVPIYLKDTYYHCKMFKFRDLSRKHHMIGWKPLIQEGNKDIVHHMLVFECTVPEHEIPIFDRFVDSHNGETCYTPNMPVQWGANCATFAFVWVVGSEGEMLPEHVGSPLGEPHGGATYFMIEMHYENAAHRTTTDSSGVRLFYTDKLRENDGATMLIGYRHSPFQLIPPKQDNFVINGICGSECTSKAIPPTGIHVITAIGHMHLVGRRVRLRHFRNGFELPIIQEDNHYDFNYQQSRALTQELTVLPGDELLAECEYSTTNVDEYVIGGLATNQEMCQVFFFYYPRIPLGQCTSQYEFHDFFKGLGIDGVEGEVLKTLNMPYEPHLLPIEDQEKDLTDDARELDPTLGYDGAFNFMNITKPNKLRGKLVGTWLKEIDWSNQRGKELEEFWKRSKSYQFCSKPAQKRVILDNHIIDYPKIKTPLKRGSSEVCQRERLFRSNGSTISSTNALVFVTVFVTTFGNIFFNK